jgi:hypothetical protein
VTLAGEVAATVVVLMPTALPATSASGVRRQRGSSVWAVRSRVKSSTWVEMANKNSSGWRPRFGDQQKRQYGVHSSYY